MDIDEIVRERGWQKFVQQPGNSVIPVVREFYANVTEDYSSKTVMQGKQVAFNNATINKYFNLSKIRNDDYHTYLEELDLGEVI